MTPVISPGAGSAMLWLCGTAGTCVCLCEEQVTGEHGGLVADLRDGRRLVPASAQWRADGEDAAGVPAVRVAQGAARVGVQSQPQWVWPGEARVKEVAQRGSAWW
jgi:hypothetical protein